MSSGCVVNVLWLRGKCPLVACCNSVKTGSCATLKFRSLRIREKRVRARDQRENGLPPPLLGGGGALPGGLRALPASGDPRPASALADAFGDDSKASLDTGGPLDGRKASPYHRRSHRRLSHLAANERPPKAAPRGLKGISFSTSLTAQIAEGPAATTEQPAGQVIGPRPSTWPPGTGARRRMQARIAKR